MNKILGFTVLAFLATTAFIGYQDQGEQKSTNLKASQNQKVQELFKEWKQKFGKVYTNIDIDNYRLSVFLDNYRQVQEHNAKKSTYKLGLNQFADLTDQEFDDIFLMKTKQEERPLTYTGGNDDFVAANVNWKLKGAVNPVQNQGACGSCYTFATAAALEGASKLQSPYGLQKFSEQQIVSCSQDYGNNGCNGGWGSGSMEYVINNGIALESTYPYVSGDANVPACNETIERVFFIQSYNNVVGQGHCKQIQQVVSSQPVYGRVTTNNWKLYTEGVFDNCSTDPNQIGHAITIVGYNTLSTNSDERYWLVKNSWGPTWGEDGYIRLKYGNSCSICHEAFAPFY